MEKGITKEKKKKSTKTKPKKDLYVFDPKPIELEETDPRRILFGAYYLNPNSPTFSNAGASALKAGFAPGYAKNILNLGGNWLLKIIDQFRKDDLLRIARDNLKKHLTLDEKEPLYYQGIPAVDENGNKIMVDNTRKIEIRHKATELVLEVLDEDFKKKEKGMFEGMPVNVSFNFFTPENTPKHADVSQETVITIPTDGSTTD